MNGLRYQGNPKTKPEPTEGVDMSVARQIRYGIGGFMLSLAMIVLAAMSLQFVFSSFWNPPQSFIVAYGTQLAILVTAVAFSWICLLSALRNKAMIAGVWSQIYAFIGLAAVGLAVAVFC